MRPLVLVRRANPWSICDDIEGSNFQAVETARFEDGWSCSYFFIPDVFFFYLETGGAPCISLVNATKIGTSSFWLKQKIEVGKVRKKRL